MSHNLFLMYQFIIEKLQFILSYTYFFVTLRPENQREDTNNYLIHYYQ